MDCGAITVDQFWRAVLGTDLGKLTNVWDKFLEQAAARQR